VADDEVSTTGTLQNLHYSAASSYSLMSVEVSYCCISCDHAHGALPFIEIASL
jgi:hypothetical protein